MKFLIIEQPLNNRGDESAHRGLITSLVKTYPMCSIKVLFLGRKKSEIDYFKVDSPNVEYVNIEIEEKKYLYLIRIIKIIMMLNLPCLLLCLPTINKVLTYYRETDYVLCAPGGMNMGGFQDWRHLAFLEIAKYLNKKTIYFARSIGPFHENSYFQKQFTKRSISLLNYFSFISLRDRKSQEYATRLNIDYTPTIDSAFLTDNFVKIPSEISFDFSSPYIVFVPNSLAWHTNFKSYTFEEIKIFWVHLLNELATSYPEHKIVMLPQTIGYSKILPDGYTFFNEIKNLSNFSNRVFVLEEQYGSDIQQQIISNAKFLIGARYHSIIFAINKAVPFISLSYEHKMNGVVDILDKKDYEIDLIMHFANQPMSAILKSDLINNIIKKTQTLKSIKDTQTLAHHIAFKGFEKLKFIVK